MHWLRGRLGRSLETRVEDLGAVEAAEADEAGKGKGVTRRKTMSTRVKVA